MLGYQSYQHRRIFDVDESAIRNVLLSHWALMGITVSKEHNDACQREISERILCGSSEHELAEKLATYDRDQGAVPDFYACYLAARAMLAL